MSDVLLQDLHGVDDEVKLRLSIVCCAVHQKVIEESNLFLERLRRKVYTTPKSYLDLVSLSLDILEEKREDLSKSHRRLSIGVQKIAEAKDVVEDLPGELEIMQPVRIAYD